MGVIDASDIDGESKFGTGRKLPDPLSKRDSSFGTLNYSASSAKGARLGVATAINVRMLEIGTK